jgi:hypothetical protein
VRLFVSRFCLDCPPAARTRPDSDVDVAILTHQSDGNGRSQGGVKMMPKLIAALSLIVMTGTSVGQPPNCASPDRRTSAILFARQINTAEAAAHAQMGRYTAIGELSVPAAPDGFQIQLSTDAATYAFSLKDTLDACHAAVFSDQAGLIYAGTPIR